MAETNGNGRNGIDATKLTVPIVIVAMVIAAVVGSVATVYAWRFNEAAKDALQDTRIGSLEEWQRKVNSHHYGFRYADMFNFCQIVMLRNPGFDCPNVYAMPTSAGDPPLFELQSVNRAAKDDKH